VRRNERLISGLGFDHYVVVRRGKTAAVREAWRGVLNILHDEHYYFRTQADNASKAIFELARCRRQLEVRPGEPPIVEESGGVGVGVGVGLGTVFKLKKYSSVGAFVC